MLPEKPATEPRRKWHLLHWTFVLLALVGGWVVWKLYDFLQAVKEAKERGWRLYYNDPAVMIRADWRAAFRKVTWSDPRPELHVVAGVVSERDFDLIRRLKPKRLIIEATFPWSDLHQLKGLSKLTALVLNDCPNLINIDALKDMKELGLLIIHGAPVLANIDALKELQKLKDLRLSGCTPLTNVDPLRKLKGLKAIGLFGCTGLKNVDGILGLTGLQRLLLQGSTGLTKEAVDAVKAALPKTLVYNDYE